MVAYIDNFYLMVIVILAALPFLLLLRRPKGAGAAPAVAME